MMNKLLQLKSIETERLILRPIQLGDEVGINQAINQSLESLQRWMIWAKDPSFETTKQFVEDQVNSHHKNTLKMLQLVVIEKESGQIISCTGFNEKSDFDMRVFEIGYWIHAAFQGKGYVTEFVNALTQFAFEKCDAIRVQILTQVENEKSIAVAKRCGFHLEATLKNHRLDCKSLLPADSYVFRMTDKNDIKKIKIHIDYNSK
ncbi:MAG: GNAT family N-acetyltransferase [Gammaproteobacteria bacterium CG_4_10_14_0_8_um_filter_38_16]|nr:MAG: GNAT family N-acetyltransferase [Gammaproteobacteria bacterium CG_4_10_14_0_8_um_filter_38_16]PJA04142.1 MAG: GNAT family N-acetyltransferase [Gammaproteobacteria bacterium CG_4_10_14_0_2_um_filter_38_22]PJB11172.1 MAG: GNAT family N-acetyltransferase [Gammaproteobacteria bacterium CG_4_9_14_3_um_filter_38_9]